MKRIEARNPLKLLLAIMLIANLAACGSKSDSAKPASQVAAKVNRSEISVHQINNAMARFPGLPEAQAKQASQQILEKLIDQEVLVQQAIESKLDRDPSVMQAIEASRRQLLAQAYLERALAAGLTKPTAQEITTFFAGHPDLFEQRRIYRIQELAVAATGEQAEKVQAEARKSKSLNDVAAWLKAQNIKFNANSAVKPAEQLPLEMLPKLSAAKGGEILIQAAPNGVGLLQIAGSQLMPLNEKEATPYIERYLQNLQRVKIAEQEVARLRGTAKVEYVGNFSKPTDTKTTTPTTPVIPATPAAADDGDFVSKGLSGLK